MSFVRRAVFVARGVRLCLYNVNALGSNLQSSVFSDFGCKALAPLSFTVQRNYSAKSNPKIDEFSDFEEDEPKPRQPQEPKEKCVLPNGNELIYQGLLANNVRNIKFFSLSTTFLALSCQPLIYARALEGGSMSDITLPIFGVIAVFAIATPLLLHIVTKRYILDIEYDEKRDKYIGSVYNIFVKKKQFEFSPSDVTIPTVLGMFTTCAVKGKPVFMDSENFSDQKHYVRIMGYDKPLDLQIDDKGVAKQKTDREN